MPILAVPLLLIASNQRRWLRPAAFCFFENKMNQKQQQTVLRIISLAAFIVAVVWFMNDHTFEPILAVLGGLGALIGSFFVQERSSGSVKARGVKSQGKVTIQGEKGGDIDARSIDAHKDVFIGHEPEKDPKG
ncbi:MAG: hypothetical protein ACPG8W_25890 [Candidatus Promineifilaceae bacterium]